VKSIFIDCETTGLRPGQSGVLQIAGFIEINTKLVETFDMKCRPFPDDKVEEQALIVNGLSKEEIDEYPSPLDTYRKFIHLLRRYVDPYKKEDKFLWFGYNAPFDMDHLRAWFTKNEDTYFGSYFFFPPIDVMTIAAYMLQEERPRFKNFKLATVAEYLNITIEEGELHTALYDIKLTKKVLEELERRAMEKNVK
jgi:DNA polymerase-3 subunit epsilon